LLGPELLSRLQIEGVAFDLFDDVFLLHLPLKAAKGVFKSLTLLKLYFRQTKYTSKLDRESPYEAPFPWPYLVTHPRPISTKNPALRTEGTDIIGG
jgi:hypothetical protein